MLVKPITDLQFSGAWRTPESWRGSQLNSHTNLTEIKDAFDLLWRNKVNPDQVNMGLAFYARTFTASSTECMSPGCPFDAGGPSAYCTNAVGIMSNSEIMRKLRRKTDKVELNKEAAVKIAKIATIPKIGREWLTYDDVDTWKLKLDFARSQCLGGVMVWAISHDTSDGKFSKQLQTVTGYKSKAVTTFNSTITFPSGFFYETTVNEANVNVVINQCRWTNCAQMCPSGWSAVRRSDPYAHHHNELMMDDTGCSGNGSRTFCCPPGKQPTCQWLSLNGGKCNPGCPKDYMYEVASTKAGCRNGKAQVACCSGDTPALAVYRQYKWKGKEHNCDTDLGVEQCEWIMPLVSSWGGSGDQLCLDSNGKEPKTAHHSDEPDPNKANLSECSWYDSFDLGLTNIVDREECNGNCPSGKIKIALEQNQSQCKKGIVAYCCNAEMTVTHTDLNENLGDALRAWVENPVCPFS